MPICQIDIYLNLLVYCFRNTDTDLSRFIQHKQDQGISIFIHRLVGTQRNTSFTEPVYTSQV